MIHFPPLRTRRLTLQLRELTIGDSLALAAMPLHHEEAACTAFLRRAVESVQGIEDPASWTVQERTLAVAHYLAATAEDGPDFSVGAGRYSDYLDGGADMQTMAPLLEVGEVGSDAWHMRHLTGAMAESIERMAGEVENATGRLHWLLGAMAAQMVREGETVPEASGKDGAGDAFDKFLVERMRVFAAYPASDFERLMGLYLDGRDKLHHLFRVEFDRDGIITLPKGGAAANLPPARFPVDSCLPRLARELVERPDESGL